MRKTLLLVAVLFSSCYVADEVAPDQEIWEYELPDNEELSNQGLLELNELIQLNQFQEINGLIIIRNDKLVFENYYNRTSPSQGVLIRKTTLRKRDSTSNIGSAGLCFALAAIGVAEDIRLLSIEDPIADYLPNYADIFEADPDKEAITIADLLTHKSGFSWNESIQPFSQENDLNQMKLTNDWIRFILEKPMEAPAGLRYNFNSGAGIILSEIIENASDRDFDAFLIENLLDPLTISNFRIDVDPQGNFNSGDGISVSLLDWTKLGYLFLNNGTWNGRRIIDPNFVAEATTLQHTVSESFSVGYFWQLFGSNFSGILPIPHEEAYFIRGGIGQTIYIIPSENMIVSIFAENYFFGLVNPSLNLFAEITNTLQ
ncbi:serine hydrolase domain-containing protein [Ekhidna sp. To15]|uniref:serine hydrolase domain-containing protein n=1 Tax=Ekhidna sp. To15 TaxID=3395267 RepID=UPI003F51D96D